VRVDGDGVGDQRATELVPRRVGGRLRVEPSRDDGGEVGERLQQHVVGALHARRLERDVGGGIGCLLVAGPPLRLGQVHGSAGELDLAVAAAHRGDRAPQPRERLGVAALQQQCESVPPVELLGEVAEPAREGHALDAIQGRAGRGGIAVKAQQDAHLAQAGELLVDHRSTGPRGAPAALDRRERVCAAARVGQHQRRHDGVHRCAGGPVGEHSLVQRERLVRAAVRESAEISQGCVQARTHPTACSATTSVSRPYP
jgi:hypothetical protein